MQNIRLAVLRQGHKGHFAIGQPSQQPLWVKTGNTQNEHMFSGPPPKADSRFAILLISAAIAYPLFGQQEARRRLIVLRSARARARRGTRPPTTWNARRGRSTSSSASFAWRSASYAWSWPPTAPPRAALSSICPIQFRLAARIDAPCPRRRTSAPRRRECVAV
jgi:hypothetical protein